MPLVPVYDKILVKMIDENQILVTREYLDCRFEIDGNAYPIRLKPITTKEFKMVMGID